MAVPQVLDLTSPWLNAAGMLGYAPHKGWPDALEQGAFITNPVSLKPRHPAGNRAYLPFNGGFLVHSGCPNPGLKAVIRKHAAAWARSPIPIWVHVISEDTEELQSMIRLLEEVEGVMAVELGLPEGIREEDARGLVQAGQGELPLVVEVPLNDASGGWLGKLGEWGASALSLGVPRGTLPVDGKMVSGRIYGPGAFPLAMQVVDRLKSLPIPVIATGGIYRRAEGEALLAAGAVAVKLEAVLWRGIWR